MILYLMYVAACKSPASGVSRFDRQSLVGFFEKFGKFYVMPVFYRVIGMLMFELEVRIYFGFLGSIHSRIE